HVTDDRQSEAQSAVLTCRRAVRLPKSIEDIRQELRINAHAGIRDRNFDVATGSNPPCLHASSLACDPHGVWKQGPDHLLYTIGSAEDDAMRIIDHDL